MHGCNPGLMRSSANDTKRQDCTERQAKSRPVESGRTEAMRFTHGPTQSNYCDRVTRRRALHIGGSGLLAGLTLPQWFQLEAEAASPQPAKAESCIFLFLEGGPSTIDMWDLKPEAPVEIRGPYRPIATSVPGTYFGEHCHRSARIAEKF